MTATNRTFRVFVSSTFNDLKAERDALQPVWQELGARCAARGASFQAIDLRWGVGTEAALDQQALPICLTEVKRCRDISPRPNFVVLLSERYGWRPPPAQIPAGDFDAILEHVDDPDARSLVQDWYERDDNGVPPAFLLRPRAACEPDPWFDTARGPGIERRLRIALDRAAERAGLGADERVRFDRSATEQEILEGSLSSADAHEHVFAYVRAVEGLPEDDRAVEYRDFVDGGPDREAVDRLADLKARLRAHLPGHVRDYTARWDAGAVSLEHVEALAADVAADLWAVISAQLDEIDETDDLTREVRAHDDFALERAEHFTGRTDELERIAGYLRAPTGAPLVIVGASGSGKSALLAEAARRAAGDASGVVLTRFIGVTAESADIRQLLRGLSVEVARAYGVDETTTATDMSDLIEELHRRLALAHADRPLRLFLDALDQLSDVESGRQLGWLPARLPEYVHVVMSVPLDPDECIRAARARLDVKHFLTVEPMVPTEGARLLWRWLASVGRTLQPHQAAVVLERFAEEGLPLYLKLAYEEARRWRSFDPPQHTQLASGIPGIIRDNLFKRLGRDEQHGTLTVERALGYLAASRNGLSENELLEILSADREVLDDFARRSPQSPHVDHLPVVVWSRLFLDLAPYLSERRADATLLLAFYHRQLREAVDVEFLAGDVRTARHRHLARYFAAQGIQRRSGDGVRANVRTLSELPFQQVHGQLWDDVTATLTDLDFLEHKAQHMESVDNGDGTRTFTGVYQLAVDLTDAVTALPPGRPAAGILQQLENAIRRELHFLGRHPSTLFQCLWNLCWWFDSPEAEHHYGAATGDQSRGFARTWESAGPKLHVLLERWRQEKAARQPGFIWVRSLRPPALPLGVGHMVLGGHSDTVHSVSVSADGEKLVSGSRDSTVRLWDTSTGVEKLVCAAGAPAYAAAISADGRLIAAAAAMSKTVTVWDAATGQQLRSLGPHTSSFECVAFSPNGRFLAAGSDNATVVVWDVDSGGQLASMRGERNRVESVAFSPDGTILLAGGGWGVKDDQYLRLWDWRAQRLLRRITAHKSLLHRVRFSPDGRKLASCSGDASGEYTIKVWSHDSDVPLILAGHRESVQDICFSPDGSKLVSGSHDETVKLWDASSGAALLSHHVNNKVNCVGFLADGRRIYSADDNVVRIWNSLERISAPPIRPDGQDSIWRLAYSPDGRILATGSESGEIVLWDARSGQRRFHEPYPRSRGPINNIAFSPDSRQLVTGTGHVPWGDEIDPWSGRSDTDIAIFDAGTGKLVHTLTGVGAKVSPRELHYSEDGKTILAPLTTGTVLVWDAESYRRVDELTGERAAAVLKALRTPLGNGAQRIAVRPNAPETTFTDQSGREIAWLSQELYDVTPDSSGTMWAGCSDQVRAHQNSARKVDMVILEGKL
jgi:WD40 repeat protein